MQRPALKNDLQTITSIQRHIPLSQYCQKENVFFLLIYNFPQVCQYRILNVTSTYGICKNLRSESRLILVFIKQICWTVSKMQHPSLLLKYRYCLIRSILSQSLTKLEIFLTAQHASDMILKKQTPRVKQESYFFPLRSQANSQETNLCPLYEM